MIPLAIILICAIGYALIRAKIDSYLTQGEWKTWAFIMGVFFAVCIVGLSILAFNLKWWMGFVMGPLFGLSFWLVFDCVVGYHFTGSILYVGTRGFDLFMRQMFLYNKPIFGWKETGAIRQILFKCFWLTLLILAYNSLL